METAVSEGTSGRFEPGMLAFTSLLAAGCFRQGETRLCVPIAIQPPLAQSV